MENKWTSGDHPNYSIVEIDWNIEKSLADLRKLAVTQTQTPVKKPSANAGVQNSHNDNRPDVLVKHNKKKVASEVICQCQ